MKYILVLLTLLISIFSVAEELTDWKPQKNLSYVYLTWQNQNTSDHITINYHSSLDYDVSQVFYSTKSQDGDVNNYESRTYGNTKKLGSIARAFHNVTITDLAPNTTYYFIVGDMKTGFSDEYKFSTLPNDSSKIRFITGGDMGYKKPLANMLEVAASTDPHFAAIGGDISYANGSLRNFSRWDRWLKMWTEKMITSDGRLIPAVVAIGNHETNFSGSTPESKAPFYFTLFKQTPAPSTYFYKTFGDHTIIYFLDTDHISSHGGAQKKWMNETMDDFKNIRNQFSVYHVPLYPSHRTYKTSKSKSGRKHWISLFDKYNLDLAFENHDHTFKVTHPLHNGEIVEPSKGTIYLGDGAWGKGTRPAKSDRWYLETALSKSHIWSVTADCDDYTYEALDKNSNSFYRGSEAK